MHIAWSLCFHFSGLHRRSSVFDPISPTYREGTACAFAGYFVRHLPLYSVLPQARGLRQQSSSWCTQLSWAQTVESEEVGRSGPPSARANGSCSFPQAAFLGGSFMASSLDKTRHKMGQAY